MIEKLIREDGKVAVLIHADYGAGWSSTAFGREEEILFDKDIARAVLGKDFELVKSIATQKYPDECLLGFDRIKVVWIPAGEEFRITEYDGYERIHLKKHEHYYTA